MVPGPRTPAVHVPVADIPKIKTAPFLFLIFPRHMWELYGLWTWFLSLYTDYLEEQGKEGLGGRTDELSRQRLASLVTFGMVGIGGIGCVFIGWIGESCDGTQTLAAAVGALSGSFLDWLPSL